jgi:hypothetical protein
MTPETPAKGVLQINDWGNSRMYKAVCACGSDDCTHTFDIEADHEITVTIYTKTRTNFWSMNRWQHIWALLAKGFVETEAVIIMPKQVALNYADVLQSAIKDLDELKEQNVKNKNR